MDSSCRALLLWSALLCVSALRALAVTEERACGLCEPARGPPVLLPELSADGAERLAWLPGIGAGGASRLVRERPGLGVPLSVDTLSLLPEIGIDTERTVRAALARWALWRAAQASAPDAQR